MSGPRLSVVVACAPGDVPRAARDIDDATAPAWLDALRRACADVPAEVLCVADDERAVRAWQLHGADGPAPIAVASPVGALVPARWAAGLQRARGDVVAFTTDRCIVPQGWARAAIAAIADGAAAAGGPIRLASPRATDRAAHALRFGALAAAAPGAPPLPAVDVAADNAAYDRRALLALALPLDEGFWEVEANRRLRARGAPLVVRGDLAVDFAGGERLWPLARQRLAHGRHAGAWRVATGARRRWQVVLAAPLVPLVLLARAWGRARARGTPTLGTATPAFLVLASAWALGEALGAVRTPRTRPRRDTSAVHAVSRR